jgi:predicted Rossmann fold flavoprotein
MNAASELNVKIRTRTEVSNIEHPSSENNGFLIICSDQRSFSTRNLLIATGGTRSTKSSALMNFTGHTLKPAVPSLFTFNIPQGGMKDLAGLSVKNAEVSIPEFNLNSQGPILITHWGLSGPPVLKLSAWGARDFHSANYTFTTTVNWLPGIMLQERFTELRNKEGKRSIATRSPFPEIPRRLWERLVSRTEISSTTSWSQLSRNQTEQLAKMLSRCQFQVQGKSMNKEEFVTCGGVNLDEVNLRTMESKRIPNLYFAGEVLNVDGITGGFNFQNAWTTGYLAGSAIS